MHQQEAKVWLAIEGGSVADGQSKRVLCPFCNGGSQREHSFVIRNDSGQFRGNCWRGTCNKWIASGTRRVSCGGKVKRQFTPRIYWQETVKPTAKLLKWLKNVYTFTDEEMKLEGLKYSPKDGRMVWPCYDKEGKEFGVNTKRTSVTTDPYPKWMTFFDRETTRLHYPRGYRKNYRYPFLCITEDIMSAVRVARIAPVVALQGTSMVWEQVRELHSQTNKIILLLDPDKGGRDAVAKIRKNYGSVFPEGIESRSLICDPKSYGNDEMLKREIGL